MMMQTKQAPILDRKAALSVAGPGRRDDHGRWMLGAVTEHRIWYCLRGLELEQEPSGEGLYQTASTQIVTRYRRDVIVEAVSGEISGQTGHAFIGWNVEMDGVEFAILNAEELVDYGRRRFMMLDCERR